jgi:hypothetical protein
MHMRKARSFAVLQTAREVTRANASSAYTCTPLNGAAVAQGGMQAAAVRA